MNTLGTALILVSIIVLAMAVGVGTGYYIITGILSAFARKPQQQQSAPALATQGVAGD